MTQSRYRRKPERRKTLLISKNFISRVDFFAEEETWTERIFDDFSVVGVSANLRSPPSDGVKGPFPRFMTLWPKYIGGADETRNRRGNKERQKRTIETDFKARFSTSVSYEEYRRMQESVVCKALYCFVGWQTWKKISAIIMCQKTANSQVWKKIMRIYDTEYKWSCCC